MFLMQPLDKGSKPVCLDLAQRQKQGFDPGGCDGQQRVETHCISIMNALNIVQAQVQPATLARGAIKLSQSVIECCGLWIVARIALLANGQMCQVIELLFAATSTKSDGCVLLGVELGTCDCCESGGMSV